MPIYEYQCQKCGSQVELMQRVGAPPPGACEECGGELKKMISAPAFQFKGTGWYVTDYARKSGEKGEKGGEKGSGEGTSGESKAGSAEKTNSGEKGASKSESSGDKAKSSSAKSET